MITGKCIKCGSDKLEFTVPIYVKMPMEYYRKITKNSISDKNTEIQGANWDMQNIICKDCKYSERG